MAITMNGMGASSSGLGVGAAGYGSHDARVQDLHNLADWMRENYNPNWWEDFLDILWGTPIDYWLNEEPCSLSTKKTKNVLGGLLDHAQEHADKISSIPPGGPNDDEKHWKEEVRAALDRAKRLAEKRLKGKTRDGFLKKIDQIAKLANIQL